MRQPAPPVPAAGAWFRADAGRALLASEAGAVREALDERPGQPWLWLAPTLHGDDPPGRGIRLAVGDAAWTGDVRCGFPLPFCSESFGAVVLQHVADLPLDADLLHVAAALTLEAKPTGIGGADAAHQDSSQDGESCNKALHFPISLVHVVNRDCPHDAAGEAR